MFCDKCNSDYYAEHGCFCTRIKEPNEALLRKPELDPVKPMRLASPDGHLGGVAE